MTDRTILTINIPQNNLGSDSLDILSLRDTDALDAIVWDPQNILSVINNRMNVDIGLVQDAQIFSEIQSAITNRFASLNKFVNQGGDLIFITRPMPVVHAREKGNKQKVFNFWHIPPLVYAGFTEFSGKLADYSGPADQRGRLEEFQGSLDCRGTLTGSELKPIFSVPGTGQMVAGYVVIGNGGVIMFVPPTQSWNNVKTKGADDSRTHFILSLLEFAQFVRPTVQSSPAWAANYSLPDERAARDHVSKLEAEIAERESLKQEQRNIIDGAQWMKICFTGFGEPLVDTVIRILRELGFSAEKGPDAHADILAAYGDDVFALEVKGKTKSASQSDINQCERWVSETRAAQTSDPDDNDPVLARYVEILEKIKIPIPGPDGEAREPKGIVIINTYRDTLVGERPLNDGGGKPNFPHATHRTMGLKNICALTGLQLLCLYIDAGASKTKKKAAIKALIETDGVISEFQDWENVLHSPGYEA